MRPERSIRQVEVKRGRERIIKRIVADVPTGTVARFKGFWGVVGVWTRNGARRFDRWDAGPIQLWPHDEIEVLERFQANGRPMPNGNSRA